MGMVTMYRCGYVVSRSQTVTLAVTASVTVWLRETTVSGCCCKEVYRYPHNNY